MPAVDLTVDPGWVDAHCACGSADAHPGDFCPDAPDRRGPDTPESLAAAEAATIRNKEIRAKLIADAKALIAELEQ